MAKNRKIKIKRALVSVSDKTGIVDFAKKLHNLNIEIISTGGTEKSVSYTHLTLPTICSV